MVSISKNYNLIITIRAQEDIFSYINTITHTYHSPLTAKKHYDNLYKTFEQIRKHPLINSIRHSQALQQYGLNVRRVNYKKMAIIYTVHDDTVFIHRVVAGSMITGLQND
jgi:plasmid stabilization system protein ParE